MKKLGLILSLIGLLTGLLPTVAASVTDSPDHLVFGEPWIEGNCRAQRVQRLHVEVTNNGTEDYMGWCYAADAGTGEMRHDVIGLPRIQVSAGETKDVVLEMMFSQAAHYDLTFVEQNRQTKLFGLSVDIGDYVAPKVSGSIQLDMLEKTADGNILYGNLSHFRITGTATLTNEDDYPIIGWGHFVDGGSDGIQINVTPWFGANNWGYPWFRTLEHELKPGETITRNFEYIFTAVPEKDKEYGIQIDVVGASVARTTFKVRQCTNTYWTADQKVKPLPLGDNQVLKVPADALAVDLRGLYGINTIFSIDASEANPNCLYYLDFLDYVPQGLTTDVNIIRDYEAKTLSVDAERDYFCPMPFKAKEALFQYTPQSETFGLPSPVMSQMMSGALLLPFDATQAWLTAVNGSPGVDAGFSGNDLKVLRFVGNEGNRLYFEDIQEAQLNAYEPYILFTKPSPVMFYAEDAAVPTTRVARTSSKDFDFVGRTTGSTVGNFWLWNCNHSQFYRTEPKKRLRPFTAYMTWHIIGVDTQDNDLEEDLDLIYTTLYVQYDDGTTTPIVAPVKNAERPSTAVYSLSGQRVGTLTTSGGEQGSKGLRSGIYIVGGRKMILK